MRKYSAASFERFKKGSRGCTQFLGRFEFLVLLGHGDCFWRCERQRVPLASENLVGRRLPHCNSSTNRSNSQRRRNLGPTEQVIVT